MTLSLITTKLERFSDLASRWANYVSLGFLLIMPLPVFIDVVARLAFKGSIPGGIEILKEITAKKIELQLRRDTLAQMENARRKTTQKVNLYKKVQIPGFEEAIRKIKRFLEDEETLAKSSQKILKNRIEIQGQTVYSQ